jgi:hypothetical protein
MLAPAARLNDTLQSIDAVAAAAVYTGKCPGLVQTPLRNYIVKMKML